ncbi:hypothetical protein [Cucumibacter marinus]|uniref:hypothetical protein n=1 Tax=Cucumibacter marinus TaxID=1121252 RepID=UPI000491FA74|nr:hypothetical protein [Cucumibacter marinus]
MVDDKKTLKFQMMMSPGEAQQLDDWMFENRLRSRAEAIRRLCQIGLALDSALPEIEGKFQVIGDLSVEIIDAIKAIDNREGSDPKTEKMLMAVHDAMVNSLELLNVLAEVGARRNEWLRDETFDAALAAVERLERTIKTYRDADDLK